jgi:hypothetical protein
MATPERTDAGRRRDARLGLVFVALASFVIAVTLAFAVAAVLRASEQPVETGGPSLPRAVWPNADNEHVDIVLSYLGATQVDRPLVLLLGGSAARECTVSDRSWRKQIRAAGGPDVLAFNLGSSEQSYDDDIGMVRALRDVPTLVFIGVNLGRYTRAPARPYEPPGPGPTLSLAQADDYPQHYFDKGDVGSDEAKVRRIEEFWLGERQAFFDENFAYNAGRLRALVSLCERRGFDPVLLNLPLNLAIVAGRLDAPVDRYRQDCLAISREHGIPFVDFVADVPLVTTDFVDNWHLVPSGRTKWQSELSRITVRELSRCGIEPSSAAP